MERNKQSSGRYRTWRERQQRGAICAQIELTPDFISALQKRGLIPTDAPPSRNEVAACAASILALWAGETKETT